MKYELVLFKDGKIELQVNVELEKGTVWLTANQMALLFEKDEKTIRKHINNIFNDDELERENNTQKMRVDGVKQKVPVPEKSIQQIEKEQMRRLKEKAELAWELHRNYWRKGYGTEIGKTLLKLGFETLGVRRIVADCNTLNEGSYEIMQKIGMRREAHYVKCYKGNSALNYAWCDKHLYAILRDEWIAL